jgi:glycosyltransferase involved in cell wall biosynthesis
MTREAPPGHRNVPLHVVLTDAAEGLAGGERFLLILAAGLRARGHHVCVATEADAPLLGEARRCGADIVPVRWGRGLRQFAAAETLVRRLRGASIDVVHTMADADRTAGAWAARRLGAASVTSVHSCFSVQRNPFHRWRNRTLIDRFLPVSHAGARLLRDLDGLPASRVTVVPNGIDDRRLAVPAGARKRVRRELNLAEEAVLVVTVGRLTGFKGLDVLLDAVPFVLARVPETRFVLVGDGERRRDLERQIAAGGLECAVSLIGWREEIGELLAACDLVVQPSLAGGGEACPLAVLEALAAGRPVVASDVGDLKRIVGGGAGRVVPPERPRELAAAVVDLAADRAARSEQGRAARRHFETHYTAAIATEAIVAIYRSLLPAGCA